MNQIRRYLKTLLTALALLMPLALYSQKVLLDTNFKLTDYNVRAGEGVWEGNFSGKGHLLVKENEFIITIPAQKVSRKDKEETNLLEEYSAEWPALTIKGKCKIKRDNNDIEVHLDGGDVKTNGQVTVSPTSIRLVGNGKYESGQPSWNTYQLVERQAWRTIELPAVQEAQSNSMGFVHFSIKDGFVYKGSLDIGLKWDKMTMKPFEGETLNDLDNPAPKEYKWKEIDSYLEIFGEIEDVQVGEDGMVASAEDDTDAPDDEGPWGTLIPIGVSAGIIGYLTYLANKYRRRRKAAKDEEPDDDPDDDEDDEEDDPDQLEMRFYKNFDGTLITGDAGRRVSACIVRHPAKGPEWVDENLTRQIEITSNDNYLVVDDDGMVNGWRSCFVSAPEDPDPPKEGVVRFRLSVDRGTYTNRVHFRIEKGEVQFDQENLTIPAGCKTAIELPFAVPGFEGESGVSAFISGSDGSTKDYSVEVKWDERKGHYFAIIQDLLPEPQKDECIPGKFIEYTLHIVAEHERGTKIEGTLPVLRFFMGLALEFKDKGEVGCYITEYDPMKHRTREELRMKAGGKVYAVEGGTCTRREGRFRCEGQGRHEAGSC